MERKRRFGDRKDAYLVRDIDSMHLLMPYNMPGRTANEACLSETIDITAVEEYIKKKNYEGIDFKYTFFHVITAALAKTMLLRPRMNYFYSGNKLWERKDIILAFVIKKQFEDGAREGLALITCPREGVSPLEFMHEEIKKRVTQVRKGKGTSTDNTLDMFLKIPRFVTSIIFKVLRKMEFWGIYPKSLMADDPYYSSCFISNLGSIKMHAQYHHLAEWGTNSFFCIIGEKKPTPFFKEDGSFEVKNAIDFGLTIDERIADGVYFGKSINLFKHLMAHPELLELPIETPVEF